MTVLRAALLFDHPTTRLFASRILESFFCSLILLLLHHFGSFLPPRPRASLFARLPQVLFCYGPSAPDLLPSYLLSRSCTLVPRQPPSIEVLCKQTHESERRIEGFPCPLVPQSTSSSSSSSSSKSRSPTTLLTFAKLSEWLRWEKQRVHSRSGIGLSDHTRALDYCVAYEIYRVRQLQIHWDIICTSTFNSPVVRRKLL